MDVVIRRALRADAPTLTRVAHAAKRHWKYPEDWIRLWQDALTVTPGFIDRHPVCCAVLGARVLGFYALSGAGATRELEHACAENGAAHRVAVDEPGRYRER